MVERISNSDAGQGRKDSGAVIPGYDARRIFQSRLNRIGIEGAEVQPSLIAAVADKKRFEAKNAYNFDVELERSQTEPYTIPTVPLDILPEEIADIRERMPESTLLDDFAEINDSVVREAYTLAGAAYPDDEEGSIPDRNELDRLPPEVVSQLDAGVPLEDLRVSETVGKYPSFVMQKVWIKDTSIVVHSFKRPEDPYVLAQEEMAEESTPDEIPHYSVSDFFGETREMSEEPYKDLDAWLAKITSPEFSQRSMPDALRALAVLGSKYRDFGDLGVMQLDPTNPRIALDAQFISRLDQLLERPHMAEEAIPLVAAVLPLHT